MNTSDTLLEDLQADVLATLLATPSLSLAKIVADDHGDIEADVERMIVTMTGEEKIGLAVVVLRPEVVTAEKNLPGPPLRLKVEIQTIEYVTLNRDEQMGTLKRSSAAALQVLGCLQLRGYGSLFLYAEKDPIKPVPVKTGFVSDAVTLFAEVAGLSSEKADSVTASVVAGTGMVVSGAGTVASNGTYAAADGMYSKSGWYIRPAPDNSGRWWISLSGVPYYISNDTTAATPDSCSGWHVAGDGTLPVPTVTATASTLALTCATSGAEIFYTTDGSYPAENNTAAVLYTAPFALPAVGTVVRAAAYADALNPGDCTEIIITD